jgi:hypothetical protein
MGLNNLRRRGTSDEDETRGEYEAARDGLCRSLKTE